MKQGITHTLSHWSLLTLLTIASVTSCEKFSRLIYFKQGGLIPASEMKVTKITPLVAKPGDEVTVTGVNLNGQTVLRLGDQSITWSSFTGDTAKFIMPKTSHPGAFTIKVGRYNDPTGAVAPAAKYMISDSADDEYPIYMASVDEICSPKAFRDAEGALQVGTKNCDTTGATTSFCTADGGSNCVVDGSTYKAAKLSNFDASKIISGTTIAGVNGTASSGGSTPPNCSAAGQQECKATGAYFAGTTCTANSSACYLPTYAASAQPLKAINYLTINNSAASIRSGITLGDVAGTLADCSSDGSTGCVTTASYKAANMANVVPNNIRNSVMIAGVTGAFESPNAWDLRVGVTVGGVAGKLKVNCRNRVNLGILDSAPFGTADVWDTIDDYNNNIAGLPPQVVSGWSNYDCSGIDTPGTSSDDDNVWKDVTTSNGVTASSCASTAGNCSMQDKITGLWWSKQQTSDSWYDAVNNCATVLNTTTYVGNSVAGYNGQTGWRLPTQKELMDAYNHGIRSAGSTTNWITQSAMASSFWSASSLSSTTTNAWWVNLAYGNANSSNKPNPNSVVCVRP